MNTFTILDVSSNYLVGNSDVELDRKTLNRILELQQLQEGIKDKLYFFIDMPICDAKAKQAYAS